MKIVDLNNYEENDGLRDKLRQRMDAHEPELSDSVWDRINHQMDKREANRKRRFLWWFSSVAVILLTSGIITYLALNKVEQPKAIAQNTKEIIITSPNNPNVKLGTVSPSNTAEGNANTQNPAHSEATINNGNTVIFDNTIALPPPPPPPVVDESLSFPTQNGEGTSTDKNTGDDKPSVKEENKTNPTKEVKSKEVESKTTELADDAIAKDDKDDKDAKAKKKTTTTPNVKLDEFKSRWFVGATFSLNQTYRTVTDISEATPFYPGAENRNKFEKRSFSPSYGIEVGFYPVKNLFIKSGIGIFNMSENVEYDVKVRDQGAQGSPLYGDLDDSIATGNSVQKQNTYQYLQIPVEVGYSRNITNKWGLFASSGAVFNILQNYNYNMYESLYGNTFIPSGVRESYTDMYKNFVMLSASIGAQYSITNRWVATLGFNYRRAITSSANEKYEVDIKPYSIGATTGLAFRF